MPENKTPTPVFWFDMDGVLSVYEAFDGPVRNMPFMVPSGHYFLDRPEQPAAMALFDALAARRDCEVRVLTRLIPDADPDIRAEWCADKIVWCSRRLAGFRPDMFHAEDHKPDVLSDVPFDCRRMHVLIDDFNENLRSWRDAGGVAVKYANGKNDPSSWPGLSLMPPSGFVAGGRCDADAELLLRALFPWRPAAGFTFRPPVL